MTTYKMTKLYGTNPVDGIPDPSGQWTGTWMDAHGSGTGAAPEDQLTGTLFSVNANQYSPITFSSPYSEPAACGGTPRSPASSAARRARRTACSATSGTPTTPDSTRPPGEIDLSSTTLTVDQLRTDYGNNYSTGQATHSLVEFRDQTSHALVFGTATVQWSWGLTNLHTDNTGVANPPNPPSQSTTVDRDVQQATMNMLADRACSRRRRRPG